ncbi:translocase [Pseudooceanicola sp. CBS1P-1]|uniref:Protein translocase subunit SecA n=1 Tax=Pseudooceanicola albus TaxID=2692189 RepID=A0A6L7G8N1_9RHOB|nr:MULTISPECIES: translocase [Pseudooceanicola]MBT9384345.1 translocase [Pseudooceanicola endophyticus]MXN19917.1 translocase [Pseudooceanicola albus]
MSDLGLIRPPARLTLPRLAAYAERPDSEDGRLERAGRRLLGLAMARSTGLRRHALRPILTETARHAPAMAALSDPELRAMARSLRPALRQALARGVPEAPAIGPAFALLQEAAHRTLGMRPYAVQLLGGFAMLRGTLAEMRTGEGKTLCATLPACTMALAGVPVHVITVNDYLALRDRDLMRPLYDFLGLSSGVVQAGQSEAERAQIYRADIVFAANKEIAFDYLRDRMLLRRTPGNLRRKLERLSAEGPQGVLRMRGLHFALIDEADSVLIDEARTPLVISGQVAGARSQDPAFLERALKAARALAEGTDYRIHANERRVEITQEGAERLEIMGQYATGAFRVGVIRDHAVVQALSALHLFRRDNDFVIRDGKVQIVDENTGRIQEDRSWSEGLHQMIELVEGVAPSDPRETLSRITYQRFFRRYQRLSGMTGTGLDAAWELYSVYGLGVVRIPPHRGDRRRFAPDRVFATEAAKWQAVAARVAALHGSGVPVLVGTRSVAASARIGAALEAAGLPHQVLNAVQDADEAAVIARAGQPGMVTVATNMAGRGTDIKLAPEVAHTGGLHVILSERHDSRRVDRQLEGRCGRQGDPGQVERFLSLEDELLASRGARWSRRAATLLWLLGPGAAALAFRARQKRVERMHARMRHDLLAADRGLGTLLAVSGEAE